VVRTVLFPADAAIMTDVWDVIGLRGTGSDNYSVKDLFVPSAHAALRDDPAECRIQAPLYHFPMTNLYAIGFAGTALGIARAMLDAFRDLALEKQPRLAKRLLRDDAMIQGTFAEAEARHRAARAYLLAEVEDIWATVLAEDRLTIAQRMRIRLAATHAIHEAKSAADIAYDLAGATTIFTGSPFERRFRDLHTVTQQLQGRRLHYQTVGAHLFGHPPDLSAI
jgi:alkylation response protein AidB-like acyl-CoA dehydrogenase